MNLLLSKDGWLVVCIPFGSSWAKLTHFESKETADEFAAHAKKSGGRVLKMCSVDEFCPTLKTELP